MISFFRKIREKLLSQNRITRYLVYAVGEIFLVVIGILIALQVNTWNENRLNRKLEIKYLKGLQRDLDRDIKGLDYMTSYRKDVINSSLKVMKMEAPSSLDELIEVNKDFIVIHFWNEFTPNNNTFQELTSSGNLSLIKSDSIKDLLMSMEALNAEIVTTRNHLRRDYEHYIYDELANYEWLPLVNLDSLGNKNEFIDIQEVSPERIAELTKQASGILSNGVIRNGWTLAIANNAYILSLYDKMRELNAHLQDLIDQELQNEF
ncbi:hypothetical protein DFQ04_1665 [Algoriphagus boseongensis]|uniref:Uncharacterized protein n=1 Tax=Algoriphagus boseongensis TaxID=1442587 RepID=A0A4R6T7Z6_9BACT|nr:DUF6090 family protein [Algoriphagus boseongensis]TDQ17017.1 hypothetical protein DFQ04_1665 [Algoriphagus boseongensis]